MKNKLRYINLIIIGSILFSALPSCFLSTKQQTEIRKEPVASFVGFTKAKIINSTLDGCTWLLELEDGKKLEPVNLKDEYKKDSLPIWIKYKHYDNFSFCMAGEMVSISAIEIRNSD